MFRLRRAGTRRDASERLPHDKAKPPAAPGRAGNYRRNAKSRPSNRSPAPLNPAAARRRATFLAPGEAEHGADALAHLLDGGLGVLGTLFSLFLVYSAGLRYLMMACALYAIGLPLLVVARRQRRPGVPLRQLFSHRGWVVLSLIVVLGVCGLVYTVHGGVFGVA